MPPHVVTEGSSVLARRGENRFPSPPGLTKYLKENALKEAS